jgi:hypothetical protein
MTDQAQTTNVPARFDANSAITRFSQTEAELKALAEKHSTEVFDVSTAKGLAVAKEVRKTFRDLRLSIEDTRTTAKADALAYGRALDTHAKKLQSIIADAEENADKQIKAEEARKQQEQEAKERAEQEKIAKENALLEGLRQAPLDVITAGVPEIEAAIERIQGTMLDELTGQAHERGVMLKAQALEKLGSILAGAKAQAAERARRAEEDAKREAEEKRAAKEKVDKERAEREQRDREDQERRKREEARASKNSAAMQQIQGISQQVMIARAGRVGVRKGGTRECIVDTLKETEAWVIDEENFGDYVAHAQTVKDSAVTQIRAMLEAFDLDVEQKAAAERLRQQQERIAEESRKQEAARLEREKKEREAKEAERIDRLRKDAPALRTAAINALGLLVAEGFAGNNETIQLKAAIENDAKKLKPRKGAKS